MQNPKINTYTTEAYLSRYMRAEDEMEAFVKRNLQPFFIVRVEHMIKAMKVPVPPAKSHSHSLLFLTEGEASMRIGSQEYTIFANQCLVVAEGEVFSIDRYDENKGYLIHFNSRFLIGKYGNQELLQAFGFLNPWMEPVVKPGSEATLFLHSLFERMLAIFDEDGLNRYDVLHAGFLNLLFELKHGYKPLGNGHKSAAAVLSERFRELVFKHLKTTHRVADYAALLNVSPNHLNKSVKRITGKSPAQWIDDALLLEAKVLLYQTRLGISEIAAEIGMEDASYFARVFKRKEGVSPTGFRKMIEKS